MVAFGLSLWSRGQQPGQSCEVVGSHRQDEAGLHPFEVAIDGQGDTADGFGPAESLFDPFAVSDRQGISLVPGRAPSIAECLNFCATWGVTQACHRSATNSAASKPLSAPGVSLRKETDPLAIHSG